MVKRPRNNAGEIIIKDVIKGNLEVKDMSFQIKGPSKWPNQWIKMTHTMSNYCGNLEHWEQREDPTNFHK